jgi:site-specific DNA recombinase
MPIKSCSWKNLFATVWKCYSFIRSPKAKTPEEELLLQFQGMIAEYERTQIAERTRRGKRHRAKAGSVNVLCGAPYGYRYIRKSETSEACYQVLEHEAQVVRTVFKLYTQDGLSINAIARWLNEQGIATRTGLSCPLPTNQPVSTLRPSRYPSHRS